MVRYELTSTIPFSAMDQFSVNRTTGHLSLLRSLDRETDSAITLVVAAFDMGVPGELLAHLYAQYGYIYVFAYQL